MAFKLGHILLGTLVLIFIIGGLSLIINEFDKQVGVSSGIVASSLSDFEQELASTNSLATDLAEKIDSDSTVYVEGDSDLETRGTDATGLLGLVSKNIVTNFLRKVTEKIPGAGYIIGSLTVFIGVFIVILGFRIFFGEAKL